MKDNTYQAKKTAKLAGLLFLLWIVIGFYDMLFVSPKIFVKGDFAASAQNIIIHELLFRTSIFSGLITNAIWIVLSLTFYKLFKQVNEYYAKLLVAFVLVQIPVAFIKAALSVTALLILKDETLTTFELIQRQDLAILLIKLSNNTVYALELFWGLWLLPLAYLIFKSKFIPGLFGILLYINGSVYLLLSFTSLVFPQYKGIVFNFGMPAMFGEVAIMLWLLLIGVRTNKAEPGADSQS